MLTPTWNIFATWLAANVFFYLILPNDFFCAEIQTRSRNSLHLLRCIATCLQMLEIGHVSLCLRPVLRYLTTILWANDSSFIKVIFWSKFNTTYNTNKNRYQYACLRKFKFSYCLKIRLNVIRYILAPIALLLWLQIYNNNFIWRKKFVFAKELQISYKNSLII